MKLIQFNSAFTHLAKLGADRTLCGRPLAEPFQQVPNTLRPALDLCDLCVQAELAMKEAQG